MNVWPYVNGRALMSGIQLMEMEGSDMMDVLHFIFEDDFTSASEEHARSRSAIRESLYRDLYGVSYKFKLKDSPRGQPRAANDFDYSGYEASLASAEPVDLKANEDISSRDNPTTKRKIKFIDASSVPLTEQSFEGLDAPLN